MQRTVHSYVDLKRHLLALLDFRNVLNAVDRLRMLQEVRERCPGLLPHFLLS